MLMPTFLLSVAMVGNITGQTLILFLILHLLVYPASNGYNTYFDRDKESIGGLLRPPPVNRTLVWIVQGLDVSALIATGFLLPCLLPGILAYQIASRAYSYHRIRIKSLPWLSFVMVGVFQGALIYVMVAFTSNPVLALNPYALAATFLYLIASYPITQSYQIAEDTARGDSTVASTLGVSGSILLTAILFPIYFVAAWLAGAPHFLLLLACSAPVLVTFGLIAYRYLQTRQVTYGSIRTLVLLNWLSIAFYFSFYLRSQAISIQF